MYRMNLPCTHQYFLGATPPLFSDESALVLGPGISDLSYDEKTAQHQVTTDAHEHISWLKKYAINNILRYSLMKRKEDVKPFVECEFTAQGPWILIIPQSIFQFISAGIEKFSQARREVMAPPDQEAVHAGLDGDEELVKADLIEYAPS
jgi:hypothetical protein